ncbi:MAG: aldo/keto reductase, partial [Lachnospiraceae bacterium]|nr:aldo/keto reductase [Lachnospiraceae bacterium]
MENKIDLNRIPKLGFGMMRLPETGGVIDKAKVDEMVDMYMNAGLNYFDTAYVYHGGKSEIAVRESVVKRYDRDSFYIADKLPAWCINSYEDIDRIFNEQLERCGVDYFDFYLLHSVEDGANYNTYDKYDCFKWGVEKKKEGKIKHFGFSFHGSPSLLEKILSNHPEVEFVQIQLNYLDWNNQVVRSGALYNILRNRNIPIIIMEPCKGGSLAKLEPRLEEMYKNVSPDKSIASWAFRYIGSLDGIMTILSGMTVKDQMEDNIRTFKNFEPLSDEESETIQKVVGIMQNMDLIPCTSCRYCCDGCPMGIRIPDIFRALNTKRLYPKDDRPNMFYNNLTMDSGKASQCVKCGQCEGVCPQHLEIIQLLEEAAKKL